MKNDFWAKGAKSAAARKAGMTPAYFGDILHRTRSVSMRVALKLESITGVPAMEWATNKISRHAAFYGKPGKAL